MGSPASVHARSSQGSGKGPADTATEFTVCSGYSPGTAPSPSDPLYLVLAAELRGAMDDGRLAPGVRLPAVREAARQQLR